MSRISGVIDQIEQWKELINSNIDTTTTTTITPATSATITITTKPIVIPPVPATTTTPSLSINGGNHSNYHNMSDSFNCTIIGGPNQNLHEIKTQVGVGGRVEQTENEMVIQTSTKDSLKISSTKVILPDLSLICSEECGILVNKLIKKVLPALRQPPSALPIITFEKKEKSICLNLSHPQNRHHPPHPHQSVPILPLNQQQPDVIVNSYPMGSVAPFFQYHAPPPPPLGLLPFFPPPLPPSFLLNHRLFHHPHQHHHHHLQQYQSRQNPPFQQQLSYHPPPPPPPTTLQPPPPPGLPPYIPLQSQATETIATINPSVTDFIVESIAHYILQTFSLQCYNFESLKKDLLNEETSSIDIEKFELVIRAISVASIFLAGKVIFLLNILLPYHFLLIILANSFDLTHHCIVFID